MFHYLKKLVIYNWAQSSYDEIIFSLIILKIICNNSFNSIKNYKWSNDISATVKEMNEKSLLHEIFLFFPLKKWDWNYELHFNDIADLRKEVKNEIIITIMFGKAMCDTGNLINKWTQ